MEDRRSARTCFDARVVRDLASCEFVRQRRMWAAEMGEGAGPGSKEDRRWLDDPTDRGVELNKWIESGPTELNTSYALCSFPRLPCCLWISERGPGPHCYAIRPLDALHHLLPASSHSDLSPVSLTFFSLSPTPPDLLPRICRLSYTH